MKNDESIKKYEIENIGDDDTDDIIEASISEDDLSVYEILSSSMYADPYSAIVREIVSNCFDSHKEANVNLPVIVSLEEDENNQVCICFEDFGVGLSPERMKNVYMRWGKSTRTMSNDYIGMFGLGSKTPHSYTESFYIKTRVDGIEYLYILYKGEKKPILELLSTVSTTEQNGTKIIIYLKKENLNSDIKKFIKSCSEQLCYFDNVIFKGFKEITEKYNIFCNLDLLKEYIIYEGVNFKYRNKNQYSSTLHIILGKVPYAINWTAIDESYVNLAIGLKFEIGDLMVTRNRESIRYESDVTINKIKEKIKLVKEEIISLHAVQNDKDISLKEYINFSNNSKILYLDYENKNDSSLNLYNFLSNNYNLEFKKIKDLGFNTPKNIFNFLEIQGQFKNGNIILKQIKNKSISTLFQENYNFVLIKKGENKTIWKNRYLENKILITYTSNYYKFIRKQLPLKSFEIGKVKLIYQYIQLVLKEMNVILYKNVDVSDEFKQNYRESRKINYESKRKIEGKITCLIYREHKTVEIHKSFNRDEKELSSFYKLKSKIIIYCTASNKEQLIDFIKIIEDFKFEIYISYIIVSNVNKEILDKLTIKNLINLDSIMLHNKFKKLITYCYLIKNYNTVVEGLNKIDVESIKKINTNYYNLLIEAKTYLKDKKNFQTSVNSTDFTDECIDIGLKYNLLNNDIINTFKEISFIFELTPFIQKIKYIDEKETLLYFKQIINYYLIKNKTDYYSSLYKLRPNVYNS